MYLKSKNEYANSNESDYQNWQGENSKGEKVCYGCDEIAIHEKSRYITRK